MFQESQRELLNSLSSELPEHYFYHMLLVRQITKSNPVSKGTQPHLSLRETSESVWPLESDTEACSGEPAHNDSFVNKF